MRRRKRNYRPGHSVQEAFKSQEEEEEGKKKFSQYLANAQQKIQVEINEKLFKILFSDHSLKTFKSE